MFKRIDGKIILALTSLLSLTIVVLVSIILNRPLAEIVSVGSIFTPAVTLAMKYYFDARSFEVRNTK